MQPCVRGLATALLACVLAALPAAHAALSDAIQVDADDIDAPGETGFTLHVNTTPRGRRLADYVGEAVPHRGWRMTPEFTLGLAPDWAAAVALPVNRDGDGRMDLAGVKLALKWLPLRPQEGAGGWFAGVNAGFARLKRRFTESQSSAELRLIVGWRNGDWLFAVNPTLGWDLSDGQRSSTAGVSVGAKATRTLATDLALGLEYYGDLGTTRRLRFSGDESHALFAVIDTRLRGFELNFGIGRGLTRAADALTVKATVGVPF